MTNAEKFDAPHSIPSQNFQPQGKCRLAEIFQWDSCGVPIPRVFRLCPGRPAIEITKHISRDDTGQYQFPVGPSQILPKGKPWLDVTRYPPPGDELND